MPAMHAGSRILPGAFRIAETSAAVVSLLAEWWLMTAMCFPLADMDPSPALWRLPMHPSSWMEFQVTKSRWSWAPQPTYIHPAPNPTYLPTPQEWVSLSRSLSLSCGCGAEMSPCPRREWLMSEQAVGTVQDHAVPPPSCAWDHRPTREEGLIVSVIDCQPRSPRFPRVNKIDGLVTLSSGHIFDSRPRGMLTWSKFTTLHSDFEGCAGALLKRQKSTMP